MSRTLKIIVQTSDNCVQLLRYVDKNIARLNKLGVRIAVEKLSADEQNEATVQMLKKKGITRLPVLVAPDGVVFIGIKKIIELFEENLAVANTAAKVEPADCPSEVADYMMGAMYAGVDPRTGKRIPRSDKDEPEDDTSIDYDKRMRDYERTMPKHRRANGSVDEPMAPQREDDDMPPVTVSKPARVHKLSSTGDVSGDQMDQRMLSALMDNIPDD